MNGDPRAAILRIREEFDAFSLTPGVKPQPISSIQDHFDFNHLSYDTLLTDIRLIYDRAQRMIDSKHRIELEYVDRVLRIGRQDETTQTSLDYNTAKRDLSEELTQSLSPLIDENIETSKQMVSVSQEIDEALDPNSSLHAQRAEDSITLARNSATEANDKKSSGKARDRLFQNDESIIRKRQELSSLGLTKDRNSTISALSRLKNDHAKQINESDYGESIARINSTFSDIEKSLFSISGGALNFEERIRNINGVYLALHQDMEQRLTALVRGIEAIFGRKVLETVDTKIELNAFSCEKIVSEILMALAKIDDATQTYRCEVAAEATKQGDGSYATSVAFLDDTDQFRCARVSGMAIKGSTVGRVREFYVNPPKSNVFYHIDGARSEIQGFDTNIALINYGAGEGDQPINWIDAGGLRNHSAISPWTIEAKGNQLSGETIELTIIAEISYVSR